MRLMKTPGVLVVERNALPPGVVEVPTAVPAFVGHTAIADNAGASLAGKPWRVASLDDYHRHFGFAPMPLFDIVEHAGPPSEAVFQARGKHYRLTAPGGQAGRRYLLYAGLQLFFQNGGGPCYIVSVGDYKTDVAADALRGGIASLVGEQEPALLVVPEAVLLEPGDCAAVQQAMLGHCGRMKSRMAILDVREGWRSQEDSGCVDVFRNSLGSDDLQFGAAYYPWVNATLVQAGDLSLDNLAPASRDLLADLLEPGPEAQGALPAIPLVDTILAEMTRQLDLLPPSAALAGIYASVDSARGVWKAPANVRMSGVASPAVDISEEEQADLNVCPQGQSVNAIRSFVGEGVLVWGARTLDGNSLDWRYINVRRTAIMLEQSCRLALEALAFEPNDANTWLTARAMIGNFLTDVWKRGGLAGAVPDDAFSVRVGLGDTMTADDLLAGTLRVCLLVAIVRPAEFIEITFQQQMHTR